MILKGGRSGKISKYGKTFKIWEIDQISMF